MDRPPTKRNSPLQAQVMAGPQLSPGTMGTTDNGHSLGSLSIIMVEGNHTWSELTGVGAGDDTIVTPTAGPTNETTLEEYWQRITARFRHVTETEIIPYTCYAGFFGCLVLSFLFILDKSTRRSTFYLLQMLLLCHVVFLAALGTVTHLDRLHQYLGTDLTSYIMWTFCVSWTCITWLLYFTTRDAHAVLRYFYKAEALPSPLYAKLECILVPIAATLYHLPLLPNIKHRVLTNVTDPQAIDFGRDLWEARWDVTVSHSTFYVMYFFFIYTFIIYALPYIMIAQLDKHMIDMIHKLSLEPSLDSSASRAANTAMGVSVFCNMYLVSASPKFVVLIFGLFNHRIHYMMEQNVFFTFLNILGNTMQVFFVALALPAMLAFNKCLTYLVFYYPFAYMRALILTHKAKKKQNHTLPVSVY